MQDKEASEAGYDKALDLAEAALEEYAHGKPKLGDKLAAEAVKTDRHAVEDLVEDLSEDEGQAK